MSWETARATVDFLLEGKYPDCYESFGTAEGIVLDFIGGEPLLEIDLIRKTVAYFKLRSIALKHHWSRNYIISISPNGLLYKDPRVQEFLKQNAGHVSIGISIDGHRSLHDRCRVDQSGMGSYDRVLDSVKLWLAQFPQASTKVTFASESLPDISEAVIHLFNLGIRDVYANVVFEDVWREGDERVYYQQLVKLADRIIDDEYYVSHTCTLFDRTIGQPLDSGENSNWCGGNGSMLAIGVDGAIYPCLRFAEFAQALGTRPSFRIGNIAFGIEAECSALHELSSISRRSQSSDECFDCSVASQCAWCTAYNYDYFGTPDKRATFICLMHKARVLANHYFWSKLYRKLGYEDDFTLHLRAADTVRIDPNYEMEGVCIA